MQKIKWIVVATLAFLFSVSGIAETSNVIEGTIGTRFILSGANFGTEKQAVYAEYKTKRGDVQKVSVLVERWSDTSITCLWTKILPPGTYPLYIQSKSERTNPILTGTFTVMKPQIDQVIPRIGTTGDKIEIYGRYFSTHKPSIYLREITSLRKKKCMVLNFEMSSDTGNSYLHFEIPNTPLLKPGNYQLILKNQIGEVTAPFRINSLSNAIMGRVVDKHGPVPGAIVRIQTTEEFVITNKEGRFKLFVEGSSSLHKLTAWANGYFCAGPVLAMAGESDILIELHPHSTEDNPSYNWLPSISYPDQVETKGCSECHSAKGSDLPFTLPVDEWLLDSHSMSAKNIRFLTMYEGTDIYGNKSPLTRYFYHKDYGLIPLPPDPTKPYYGPGYRLDFPKTAGNCAACHTPAASVNNPYGIDPTTVKGVDAEGIPCDFCHKVWGVKMNYKSSLPYDNMPGVLSFEFRRPPNMQQFFSGPFDDVAPGEDTYSKLQTQSQFCAPCHFGKFWDTVVYNSFGEWLESPYSDPKTGKTCQDCHMPHIGATHFALPEKGGLARNPKQIFSHRMPGAMDKELLRNAVTMKADAYREKDKVIVEVYITNDKTGHHVPTDSPLRHLILLVQAIDQQGNPLKYIGKIVLPEWCGKGNYEEGNYAGLPGKIYAKVLQETWLSISPTGAYWNPTRIVSDNRLAAFESDKSIYTFDATNKGEIIIEVRLLFRRAFKELMDQKGWDIPDIIMAEHKLHLR